MPRVLTATLRMHEFLSICEGNYNIYCTLQFVEAGPTKRLFGFVAGRTLKPKIPGPVVCVAPYNLKPNCTIAVSYPWVGFEIQLYHPQKTLFWGGSGGGADLGFSL